MYKIQVSELWHRDAELLQGILTTVLLQVGSDDEGYPVRLSLADFLLYMHHPEHSLDDSPLYIFDGSFAEKKGSRSMKHDYDLPSLFSEDLMQHGGERRRPPFRSHLLHCTFLPIECHDRRIWVLETYLLCSRSMSQDLFQGSKLFLTIAKSTWNPFNLIFILWRQLLRSTLISPWSWRLCPYDNCTVYRNHLLFVSDQTWASPLQA